MKIGVHIHNLDVMIKNLKNLGPRGAEQIDDTLFRCMNLDLYPQWVKQISLNDHTLQELAKLGHPYSQRFQPDSFVHLDEVVHVQDGSLLGGSSVRKSAHGYQLVNVSPEYVFLRYGTYKMRMRDPGGAALRDALPAMRRRFASEWKGRSDGKDFARFRVS